MSWLIIVLAGVFEVLWAVGLKLNVDFSRPILLLFTVLSIGLSMGLLALAMKELPLGTAYAVWTGIGVIGAFIVGIVFFRRVRLHWPYRKCVANHGRSDRIESDHALGYSRVFRRTEPCGIFFVCPWSRSCASQIARIRHYLTRGILLLQ